MYPHTTQAILIVLAAAVIAASMGLLWFERIILYSISTVKLGVLGPVIGWPLFLAAIVIVVRIGHSRNRQPRETWFQEASGHETPRAQNQ